MYNSTRFIQEVDCLVCVRECESEWASNIWKGDTFRKWSKTTYGCLNSTDYLAIHHTHLVREEAVVNVSL